MRIALTIVVFSLKVLKVLPKHVTGIEGICHKRQLHVEAEL